MALGAARYESSHWFLPTQTIQHYCVTAHNQEHTHIPLSHDANDHHRPCTNCLKKSRADQCKYAPKPVKNRPPKSMAARLKRLEGMVREMLDEDGNLREPSSEHTAVGEEDDIGGGDSDGGKLAPSASGAQVIRGPGARGGNTTYVGATHFMAMLGDVSALIVLLTIPLHHGPRDTSSTPKLCGEKYCTGIMVTARELTQYVLHRSRTSRATLTTRRSMKKWTETHPSTSPTVTRPRCSLGTEHRQRAGRISWICCHQSTSPTDWSCDTSMPTRPHSVRKPLLLVLVFPAGPRGKH